MRCKLCKKEPASAILGFCAACIKEKWSKVKADIKAAHAKSRAKFGLPPAIPKKGKLCGLCANRCRIPPGEKGYCGLTENRRGKLVRLAGTPTKGLLRYYYDPLPTNCVSAWACAATGRAFPKFSVSSEQETGCNLAVFYGACPFNCLFCQNWEFRYMTQRLKPIVSAKKLAAAIKPDTRCVCFFGGDPAPQLPHAIATAKAARAATKRILRFCLETNGKENPALLKQFAQIALENGGTLKFDLKFWSNKLALAISGVSNKEVYINFRSLAKLNAERPNPPLLTASTLLIPHYIDAAEVSKMARFIASVDKGIPYSLLAFYPTFLMTDLPTTSWKQAKACYSAAKAAGLRNVRIGNVHLLR